MAIYRYSAINQTGQQISGEMEAQSREYVIRQLTEAGHFPINADLRTEGRAGAAGSVLGSWGNASPTQITQFTRQLAMLLAAGLTLPRAMGLIEEEAGNSRLGRIAQQVRADIVGGKSLAEALEARRRQF